MISEEISNIKNKYEKTGVKQHYSPCTNCKNTYAFRTCLECELCGRVFEDGVLVKEAEVQNDI